MAREQKHSTLMALTSSALLLPAYQAVRADAPPEFTQLGLRYSSYEEDDIGASRAFGASSERYRIDVAQLHLLAPVADSWAFALDVQWEDMSGASPWFVGHTTSGNDRVIMSGASIEDNRTEVSVTTRYYYDRGSAAFNYTRSDEDDYQSDAFAVDASFDSDDGLTTYSAAISLSDDDIKPTQGSVPTHTLHASKDSRSAWLGVSRIISKRALLRFGLSYTYRDGFLTDPYKLRDNRPGERKEWTASAGYRQFIAGANAALHMDYRYFDDDWGVASHTVDLAWQQNIGQHTRLTPFLRYYSQSEARFFATVADVDSRYHADDYRLSTFGALSGGLRLRHDLGDWSINLAGERYSSSGSLGLDSADEAPGLVDYWRYSIGLDYTFR